MAKPIVLGLALLATLSTDAAVYLNNFHKTFNASAGAYAAEIKRTADGGYVVAANVFAGWLSQPGARILVMKLNANFAVQWEMVYMMPGDFSSGFLGSVTPRDIFQTPDGGYIVCGQHVEEFAGDTVFQMRLDSAGNVLWYMLYPAISELNSVVQIYRPDGFDGFMACGMRYLNTYATPTILKTDASGSVEWVRDVWSLLGRAQYAGSYTQIIRYTDYNNNPVAAMVGNTNQYLNGCNFSAKNSDILVTMADTLGTITFNLVYGEGDVNLNGPWATYETGESIARDPVTDELIIVGNSTLSDLDECTATAYDDMLAFKIDALGTVQWANRYNLLGNGHQDSALHVIVSSSPDRRALIAGWSDTNLLGPSLSHDMALLQLTNSQGGVLGSEVFGGSDVDESPSLSESAALTPVIIGNTMSYMPQNLIYLVEDYATKLRRCRDQNVLVQRSPATLPTNLPFYDLGATPDTPVPVVGVPRAIVESTVCYKTEALVGDPVSVGTTTPATWHP